MGNLTLYLQQEFAAHCPRGWQCRREVSVLPGEISKVLGFSSRADVLLERTDGTRRLWVEFEVSRADPVANHAKFATAHLFRPQAPEDAFVAMVSSHVNRGRRNLAASTISLMRHIGMNAFQTMLLPQISADEIKRLNHLDRSALAIGHLAVEAEIARAMTISETVLTAEKRRIHLAGDLLEVVLNLRRWNQDVAASEGKELWRRRTVTYFVHDPLTNDFAPSKFCAYVAIPTFDGVIEQQVIRPDRAEMTVALYVTLDGTDSRFDGRRAWTHLTSNLAMSCYPLNELPGVKPLFEHWLSCHSELITVHPSGPMILLPPQWFK
jgi:hypothetical protein